ncbi:MAG: methylated-DNA--[protein]-cysteine S-methyltransferase [Methylovulum sp.]|nr:methylated-DNA--[protein]-cysteine S-methyltransferase [Methylovulum sp.]
MDTNIRFAIAPCTLGLVLAAVGGQGLCSIAFGDDTEGLTAHLLGQFPGAQLGGDDDINPLLSQLIALIEAPYLPCTLPLDIQGTAFQQQVWQALRDIPPGATFSYSQLARHIGAPNAVRAVAGACAANKLAVAIPCHRAVNKNGSLSGYRWGLARKAELLRRESQHASDGQAFSNTTTLRPAT